MRVLLRLQGLAGVRLRGPARREKRGGEGRRDQHEGGSGEGERVAGAAALEEQRRDEAAGPERGQPARDDADHRQREAAREYEAEEVPRWSSSSSRPPTCRTC